MNAKIQERLWKKVNKTNTCWLWTASLDTKGYGQFANPSSPKGTPAHKSVYELLISKVPKGLELDHLCRNKSCVNPEHLEVVTRLENLRRRVWSPTRKKRTYCKNGGHLLIEGNLYWSNGRRTCKTCKDEKKRAGRLLIKNKT